MTPSKVACVFYVLLSVSYVLCEVEDLQPLLKSTEDTLQKGKAHVEHMLNLNPLPHEDKLPPLVKNESDHLAYEINKLATSLHDKIAVGEHTPEMKDAVTTAVTHLKEAATTLDHVGSDLKQDNVKYYEAGDVLLREAKNIVAAGPCHELAPVLKGALHELTHDVNNYEYGIHDVIGPHEGAPTDIGHHAHAHAHAHHVHSHHAQSSEESNESNDKSSSNHHHHHHH